MKYKKIIIIVLSIVIVLSILFKCIPIIKVYLAKQNAQTLIERLDSYCDSCGVYPKTIVGIGIPQQDPYEEFTYRGMNYFYIRYTECNYVISFYINDVRYAYYSIARQWLEGDYTKTTNRVGKQLYKQYLYSERHGEIDSISIHPISKEEQDSIIQQMRAKADSIVFVEEFYHNKSLAAKGYSSVDKNTNKIIKQDQWIIFSKDRRSFWASYHNGKGEFLEEGYFDLNALNDIVK